MKPEDDDEDLLINFFCALAAAFAVLIVAFVVIGVGITLWSFL
jgi:hypothetical protein